MVVDLRCCGSCRLSFGHGVGLREKKVSEIEGKRDQIEETVTE